MTEPRPRQLHVNGVELTYYDVGVGPTVLLLHGFPDSAALWREVVPRLVAGGYRTIALDQRGFGSSDAPLGKENYALSQLAADAVAVLDALEVPRAHLVGHDWGAAVGWLLAGQRPARFETYAALSVGHAEAYGRAGFPQLLRAWYIALMLVPVLGEWLVRAGNWYLLRATTNHGEAKRWIADLSRLGRLTAGLNWYRANVLAGAPHARVGIPVLGVWSSEDFALTERQMTLSEEYVDAPFRYERIEGASHWLQLDAAEIVSALLLDFWATSREA